MTRTGPDPGVIGNGSFGAPGNARGRVVCGCLDPGATETFERIDLTIPATALSRSWQEAT